MIVQAIQSYRILSELSLDCKFTLDCNFRKDQFKASMKFFYFTPYGVFQSHTGNLEIKKMRAYADDTMPSESDLGLDLFSSLQHPSSHEDAGAKEKG